MRFVEETNRKVESLYLTPDVFAQRLQVLKGLDLAESEKALDIGSGPGLLAYGMSSSVGPAVRVSGIDISDDMLAMPRRRCADQPRVELQTADATEVLYPDSSFDAAASTQFYEYIPDISAALAEPNRVLRPGGRADILDTDYGSPAPATLHQIHHLEGDWSAHTHHFFQGSWRAVARIWR